MAGAARSVDPSSVDILSQLEQRGFPERAPHPEVHAELLRQLRGDPDQAGREATWCMYKAMTTDTDGLFTHAQVTQAQKILETWRFCATRMRG